MQTDFEKLVIGALLKRPEIDLDLTAEMFASSSHQQAYAAIQAMQTNSDAIDLFTVGEYLKRDTGRDWTDLLADAMQTCYAPGNAKVYAEQVRQGYQTNQARVLAERLVADIEAGGLDAIDTAIRGLMELGKSQRSHDMSLKQALSEAVDQIDRVFSLDGALPGVTTGLVDLDKILGGFHDSDLTVLGARPSMGKTALLLNFALAADCPAGIISSEQPGVQVGTRMIAMQGHLHANKLRNADLEEDDWPKITRAVSQLAERNIYINDKSGISIAELSRQARTWQHRHGIKILYVDYIQRINALDQRLPRHEQVAQVAMGLKELARDLDIPIVALAQVNRDVEKRTNKRPLIADLKDSGAIEQEADTIGLLYRDEVYNPDSPDVGAAEIDIGKNRHGPVGHAKVAWLAHCMRFENFVQRDRWSGPEAIGNV